MDLRSDNSFWPIENGTLKAFPKLYHDESCDVVIIGGGITGALIAESFSRVGIKTIVVDKRHVAHGSTSASTALLQYEIDEPLYSLQKKIGKEAATTAYKLCGDAIHYIEKLVSENDIDCIFSKHPSLYFSCKNNDEISLEKEYNARKEAGFDVNWLEEKEIQSTYGFKAECAIHSSLAAQLDPYRFTYALLNLVEKRGGKVFETTNIIDIKTDNDVLLVSKEGFTITAKKVIFAVGYEAKSYLKEKTADLISTYACITKPLDEKYFWHKRDLLWNTDDPYLYARTTEDNRIIFGGEDIEYEDDEIRDKLIPDKREKLIKTLKDLFPNIPFEVEYAWAGTFGTTKDALPYIGESPEWHNAYFALGYGGNGITFSAIAAQALVEAYQGNPPDYMDIFRFGR